MQEYEIEFWQEAGGDLSWHLIHTAGREVLTQGSGYRHRQDLLDALSGLYPDVKIKEVTR